MDKVSNLPTFILHHILSFFPKKEKDAIIPLLSKRWNSIWESFPVFKFHQHDFLEDEHRYSEAEFLKQYRLMNVLDKSLQRFIHQKFIQNDSQILIERFDLDVDINRVAPELVSMLDRWMELVLDNGVRELFLRVSIARKSYTLPEKMFHGKSINGTYSKFNSLQNLQLQRVHITENIIQDVIHNCPNINYFVLQSFDGLKSLEIFNLHKLECVILSGDTCKLERVNIDAPNLKSFCASYLHCEISLTSCHDLKELRLKNCGITDDIFHLLLSRLSLLEFLQISDCHLLRRIRISAQRLKHLYLCGRDKIEMIEIDAPTLSSFTYRAYNISTPLLFLQNVLCPMEILYSFDQYNNLDSSWFLKLREFLGVSTQRKKFQIHFIENQVSFDLEELGEVVIPPMVEVDHLMLTSNVIRESINHASLIDGLLWSCHPKSTSIPSDSMFQRKCIQLLYERLLNREVTKACCSSSHIKCWRHDFKSAKIEILHRAKEKDEPRVIHSDNFSDATPFLKKYDQVRIQLVWDY